MTDHSVENDARAGKQASEAAESDHQITPPLTTVAPTSKRQAFRDVRRQLTDVDLQSPGVQKLILDELEESEAECEQLQTYIERFHEADKRAGILEERLKPARAIDVFFGVGIGLGGAIVGLSPFFWTTRLQGVICLVIGIALIGGAVVGKAVKG